MSKNSVVLTCKSCGKRLSKPVQIYESGVDGAREPEFNDDQHLIQNGFAYKAKNSVLRRNPKILVEYWMTMNDLFAEVQLTSDVSRLNGCCGLDGCDGPNRVCSCGAYVGTERSDCWTSFYFITDPQKTVWQSV